MTTTTCSLCRLPAGANPCNVCRITFGSERAADLVRERETEEAAEE